MIHKYTTIIKGPKMAVTLEIESQLNITKVFCFPLRNVISIYIFSRPQAATSKQRRLNLAKEVATLPKEVATLPKEWAI